MPKYTISLPNDVGRMLDAHRGDVPRSMFIRRSIEERIGRMSEQPMAEPRPRVDDPTTSSRRRKS